MNKWRVMYIAGAIMIGFSVTELIKIPIMLVGMVMLMFGLVRYFEER